MAGAYCSGHPVALTQIPSGKRVAALAWEALQEAKPYSLWHANPCAVNLLIEGWNSHQWLYQFPVTCTSLTRQCSTHLEFSINWVLQVGLQLKIKTRFARETNYCYMQWSSGVVVFKVNGKRQAGSDPFIQGKKIWVFSIVFILLIFFNVSLLWKFYHLLTIYQYIGTIYCH
jgi:hypothetical protein